MRKLPCGVGNSRVRRGCEVHSFFTTEERCEIHNLYSQKAARICFHDSPPTTINHHVGALKLCEDPEIKGVLQMHVDTISWGGRWRRGHGGYQVQIVQPPNHEAYTIHRFWDSDTNQAPQACNSVRTIS